MGDCSGFALAHCLAWSSRCSQWRSAYALRVSSRHGPPYPHSFPWCKACRAPGFRHLLAAVHTPALPAGLSFLSLGGDPSHCDVIRAAAGPKRVTRYDMDALPILASAAAIASRALAWLACLRERSQLRPDINTPTGKGAAWCVGTRGSRFAALDGGPRLPHGPNPAPSFGACQLRPARGARRLLPGIAPVIARSVPQMQPCCN